VSLTRDKALANQLMHQVRACAQALCAVLVCTDGWVAYPQSIQRAFWEKVRGPTGRGRPRLQIWPQVHIGTISKHRVKKRVSAVSHQVAHGTWEQVHLLVNRSEARKGAQYRVY
jgi:hypothetical protein